MGYEGRCLFIRSFVRSKIDLVRSHISLVKCLLLRLNRYFYNFLNTGPVLPCCKTRECVVTKR